MFSGSKGARERDFIAGVAISLSFSPSSRREEEAFEYF